MALAWYLEEKGWTVVKCPLEANIQIALDCKPMTLLSWEIVTVSSTPPSRLSEGLSPEEDTLSTMSLNYWRGWSYQELVLQFLGSFARMTTLAT